MFKAEAKPEDLERVADPSLIRQTLREATATGAQTFLWDYDHTPEAVDLRDLTQEVFLLTPSSDNAPPWFKHLHAGTRYVFNIRLHRAAFFFKTSFVQALKQTIFSFEFPQSLFKLQRRKSVRLPLPQEKPLWISFHLPSLPTLFLKKRLLDLSDGGCSFLVEQGQEKHYHIGDRLQSVVFQVKDRSFRCEAEVRHCQPLTTAPPFRFKIGVAFSHLNATEKDYLTLFVFDALRQYYSKFVE